MAKASSETRIRNAKSLARKLEKIPKTVQNQIQKTMIRGVERVAKRADEDAPVLSGALGGSINAKNIDGNKFRWGIYAKFYWLFVEFGTKKRQTKSGANRGSISPQPFFMPHWRKFRKAFKNSVKRNVKKELKRRYGKR